MPYEPHPDYPDDPQVSAESIGTIRTITIQGGRLQDYVWTARLIQGYPTGGGYWKPDTTPRNPPRPSTGTTREEREAKEARDREEDRKSEERKAKAQAEKIQAEKERDEAEREERKARQKETDAIRKAERAEDAAERAAARAEAETARKEAQAWAEKKDAADRRERTADRTLQSEIAYANSRREDRRVALSEAQFAAELASNPINFYNYIRRMWGDPTQGPPTATAAGAAGVPKPTPEEFQKFAAAFKAAFGRDATDQDWNNVAGLTGYGNELILTLPMRVLAMLPTSRLQDLSNEDLLPILKANPGMLKAFSAERLATFGAGVLSAIDPTYGAPTAGKPPEMDPQLAQQLKEWQAARTAKGEDPNDMAAFRAHVIAMGSPDPGVITPPALPGNTSLLAEMTPEQEEAARKEAQAKTSAAGAPTAGGPPPGVQARVEAGAPVASGTSKVLEDLIKYRPPEGTIFSQSGDGEIRKADGSAMTANDLKWVEALKIQSWEGGSQEFLRESARRQNVRLQNAAIAGGAVQTSAEAGGMSLAQLEKYPDEYLLKNLSLDDLAKFRPEFLVSRPALLANMKPETVQPFSGQVLEKHGVGAPAPPMPKGSPAPTAATGPGSAPAVPSPAAGAPVATSLAQPGPVLASAGGAPTALLAQGPGAQGAPVAGLNEQDAVAAAEEIMRRRRQQQGVVA